jgi:hypothetical protein
MDNIEHIAGEGVTVERDLAIIAYLPVYNRKRYE